MRTELLQFNGAVERDPAIDAWMKEHAGGLGAIANQWFEVMRRCGDEVRELLHDGCPVACLADRQRMMHDHGIIGRRYADSVRQIITGSIGFDDWEWGVDLFAEDPLVFKKLIYEMRFDEVSAVYALFGQFFIGVRLRTDNLASWLSGKLT